MKNLNRLAMTAAKILEVIHWLGAGISVAAAAMSIFAQNTLGSLFSGFAEINIYGFEINLLNSQGMVNIIALRTFAVYSLIILSLMAMVFRNVYLIFKTAEGRTWFSKGTTPFQHDITRMVREIGIFYISVPVIGLIMSVIARMVIGYETAEISMSLSGLISGILILCLSQVFSYGMELQKDVDGLL